MDKKKYSIILPVCNGGEHVKECVHSILAQAYTGFNLIVLDNCSTDGTSHWIQQQQDERIVYWPSEKPLSIEENWGRIQAVSKNEFMTMIGHDDILLPDYLTVMNELIENFPDASLYQTHFNYIDSAGKFIKHCKKMAAKETAPEFLKKFLNHSIDIMGTGFMMRSKDYDAVEGIPKYPNLLFADLELWVRLTALSYKATATTECFYYRLHDNTTKTSPDIKLQLSFEQCIMFLKELKQKDETFNKTVVENSIVFISYNCSSFSHRLLRTPVHKRNKLTVSSFVKKCKMYADILVPDNSYDPTEDNKVKLAEWIDSNVVLRKLFLLFKKMYSKPLF